ncbi:medium-chain acyl-[acyl-carrier-protein] hydrolase [Pelomyxa schiedti]|nr:medium-chain acyl-[acyl-carrier-protein] hydrolase [Pelomyxa schiedti]
MSATLCHTDGTTRLDSCRANGNNANNTPEQVLESAHQQPHNPKRRRTLACCGTQVGDHANTRKPVTVSESSVNPLLDTEAQSVPGQSGSTVVLDSEDVTTPAPSSPSITATEACDVSTEKMPPGKEYPGSVEPRSPWIGTPEGPQKYDSQVYLFCFHGRGGNHTDFKKWHTWTGSSTLVCAVELPGHFSRYSEPLRTDFDRLVKEVASALINFIDRPYAIFGHSMGALLGFEVAREMRRINPNLAEPLAFFLSGRKAVHLPNSEEKLSVIEDPLEFAKALSAKYEDQALTKLIREKPESIPALISVAKADTRVSEGYTFHIDSTTPFHCPIHTFLGANDKTLSVSDLGPWQLHTLQPLVGPLLIGGSHNYMVDNENNHTVASAVDSTIQDILSSTTLL